MVRIKLPLIRNSEYQEQGIGELAAEGLCSSGFMCVRVYSARFFSFRFLRGIPSCALFDWSIGICVKRSVCPTVCVSVCLFLSPSPPLSLSPSLSLFCAALVVRSCRTPPRSCLCRSLLCQSSTPSDRTGVSPFSSPSSFAAHFSSPLLSFRVHIIPSLVASFLTRSRPSYHHRSCDTDLPTSRHVQYRSSASHCYG